MEDNDVDALDDDGALPLSSEVSSLSDIVFKITQTK